MKYFLLINIFLLLGCSTQKPTNNWEYQSVATYKSFERYYLEYKLDLASMELDNARSYATQSANLTSLARIELSYCALRVAMLESFSCPKYESLKPLIGSIKLDSYAAFLALNIKKEDIKKLPIQYQEFAIAQLQKDPQKITAALKEITPLTSQMIAASLAYEYLSSDIIESIIKSASYHGYKYAVIQWLKFQLQQTNNSESKKIILQKLHILQAY